MTPQKDNSKSTEGTSSSMSFKKDMNSNGYSAGTPEPLAQKDIKVTTYLERKSERITTAVYVITDLFPEDEPLRKKLRESVLEILDCFEGKGHEKDGFDTKREVREESLKHLISLWNLAFYAGYIGEGNFSALKNEVFRMLELLAECAKSSSFGSEYFAVPSEPHTAPDEGAMKRKLSGLWNDDEYFYSRLRSTGAGAGRLEGSISQEGEERLQRSNQRNPEKVATHSASEATHPEASRERKTTPKPAKKKSRKKAIIKGGGNDRKQAIVAFIEKKGSVGVKDVAMVIQGLSEKTLQRELTALVSSGILVKTGERRWSRYSLA